MFKKSLILFAVLFVAFFSSVAEARTRLSFPGQSWDTMSFFQARINEATFKGTDGFLDKIDRNRNTPFFIARFGKKVDSISDNINRDISSACKPFITHFLLHKVDTNEVSLEEYITNTPTIYTEIENFVNGSNDPRLTKNRNIKWKDFANQTSNYGVAENPGAAFSYNDYQTALFWDYLFGYVYNCQNQEADNELHTLLTNAIQCDGTPTFFGGTDPIGRMTISARDFARFGLLYLNRGTWQTTELIDHTLVKKVTSEVLPSTKPRSQYHSNLDELSTIFSSTGLLHFKAYTDPGYGINGVMTDVEDFNDRLAIPLTNEQIITWEKKINIPVIKLYRSLGENKLKTRDQDEHWGSFGWMWWKNGIHEDNTYLWHIDPINQKYAKGVFAAIGDDGFNVLLVFPRLNLVVTWINADATKWNPPHSWAETSCMNVPINALLNSIEHRLDSIVTMPNGGETLNHGASYKITWDAFEFSIFEDLNIFLYKDGQKLGRIHPITPFIGADTEEYNWSVGTYYDANNAIQHVSPNTTGYKIEISSKNGDFSDAGDITDKSDDTFSIGDPLQTFTITASAGAGGTITPSGSVTVTQTQSETFTISANSGYGVEIVTVDGVAQGTITSYTFSDVQANHTIAATFALLPTYTITATAGAGGTITPSGSVAVTQGQSKTFTIAANSGYGVLGVTVDGVAQGAITSYTFSNAQTNHTITATFAQIGVTIVTPNSNQNWEYNTYQNITWNAPGITGNIQLSLYRNGNFVGWIANCPAINGTYSWKVGTYEDPQQTAPAGSGYKIKINSWGGSYVDYSDVPFSISRSPGSLTLTAPNGGESWQRNTYQNITWSAPGVTGNVALSLYRNGSRVGWIANCPAQNPAQSGNGSYSWKAGTYEDPLIQVPVGSGYAIEIKSMDGSYIDESNAAFNIVSPGVNIDLIFPNGGESWQHNTYQNITWNASGVTGNVAISLYRRGSRVGWIANRPASSGSYSWKTGTYEDPQIQVPIGSGYAIEIKSTDGSLIIERSDGTFTIL